MGDEVREAEQKKKSPRKVEVLDRVTVKFAGDSGDGIQLMGVQFANTTAVVGNDIATLPDFPAEIRAPAGTTYGVSSYQIQFASYDIFTPGDNPDVLVAFNPAALKVNLPYLKPGGIIIVNEDEFTPQNLKKAGFDSNPLEDGSLSAYRVYKVPISRMTLEALRDLPLNQKQKLMCKNFFALGLVCWLFSRPTTPIEKFINTKFASKPELREANLRALKAGYNAGDILEIFPVQYQVPPAHLEPGKYKSISGALATTYGIVTVAQKFGKPVVYASYPITPASEILHNLAPLKQFNVVTVQAEDEIAAITIAIGASWAGAIGMTGTSGPGLSLKSEALNLAVMVELPLVVFDFERSGPSTGMPTKTEQTDLLFALFGRHGESPVVVIAPKSPADSFNTVLEAARIAVKYTTPVIVLSDLFIVNSTEPWKIPDPDKIPEFKVEHKFNPEEWETEDSKFYPYARHKETLARPWIPPGTPGFEHRVGGLEKSHIYGNVSYEPDNHDFMVKLRARKVEKVAQDIPPVEVEGVPDADVVVVSWGSTYGHVKTAVEWASREGYKAAHVHLRYLNPFPPNLKEVLQKYKKVLVPELNLGQLRLLLQGKLLVESVGYNKVTGKPFTVSELYEFIKEEVKLTRTH